MPLPRRLTDSSLLLRRTALLTHEQDMFDKQVNGGTGVSSDTVEDWIQQSSNPGLNDLDLMMTNGFWGPDE
jgi:hypothetical protein